MWRKEPCTSESWGYLYYKGNQAGLRGPGCSWQRPLSFSAFQEEALECKWPGSVQQKGVMPGASPLRQASQHQWEPRLNRSVRISSGKLIYRPFDIKRGNVSSQWRTNFGTETNQNQAAKSCKKRRITGKLSCMQTSINREAWGSFGRQNGSRQVALKIGMCLMTGGNLYLDILR